MQIQSLTGVLATLLLSLPATATTQDADEQIIVQGDALEEPSTIRAAVRELAFDQGPDVPLTRFFDRLCLSVSGLNQTGNAYLANRIIDNAREAGLEASGDCTRANALVLIYGEPEELIERIVDEQPWLLPNGPRIDVEQALAHGEQVLVWHNEEMRNVGGRPVDYTASVPGGDRGVHVTLSAEARVNPTNWPSRTSLDFSRGIVSAAIILDADIVAGMEIDRLADYATMRLLAPGLQPQDDDEATAISVTAPFPAEGGPRALTQFDAAYLKALYSLPPNASAIRLPGAVARAYMGED